MNNKTLTNVALRYRAVFLDINRENINMRSEASVPVMAFTRRLKENGFCVSEELLHVLNAVSADRLAEITKCINDVMGEPQLGTACEGMECAYRRKPCRLPHYMDCQHIRQGGRLQGYDTALRTLDS